MAVTKKKKTMKTIIRTLLFGTAMLLTACGGNISGNRALQESNDSLKSVIAERDASLEEILECIRVVEEGFKSINEAQGRISATGIENGSSRKKQLEDDVLYIAQLVEKNNAEIARLKKLLAASKNSSKELKAIVENLEKTLQEKNMEIAELQKKLEEKDVHIAELDTIITNLMNENTEQELRLVQKEREMNSVWYAMGTKRELKGEKILSGSDVMTDPDANMDYFTRGDINELLTIETGEKRVKVISTHPKGSYKIVEDEKGLDIVKILSPREFWSVTRYLVILVR